MEKQAMSTILKGWAEAIQGQKDEGIDQIRQGLNNYQRQGAKVVRPYYLSLLAEAYEKKGQVQEGLAALAEALDETRQNGEKTYEAELHRLKGELLLKSKSPKNSKSRNRDLESEAEHYFFEAIEIARQYQEKSLELRAVMSLSRLLRQQRKKREARQMLAEIYGWFTEGFDTADLQEAKALLQELA
jgi:predicted ATPase